MISTKISCVVEESDCLEVHELAESVRVSMLLDGGRVDEVVVLGLKKTKQLVLALNNAILAMEENKGNKTRRYSKPVQAEIERMKGHCKNQVALDLLKDVVSIAQYKMWGNESGDEKARDLIDEIHDGRHGSVEGLWVQVYKALGELE
jgi:hypothetical protein